MKRYICKDWYSDTTRGWYSTFSARIGTLRASDDVNVIKDKIHILPSLCFYFNHYEFYIGFAWFVFDIWYLHINYKKEQEWRESRLR